MSDIKFCPSCGTQLSSSSVFCHGCGQRQNVLSEPEPVVHTEPKEEKIADTSVQQQEAFGETSPDQENKEAAGDIKAVPEAEPQIQPQIPSSEAQPQVIQQNTYTAPFAAQTAAKPVQPQAQPVYPTGQTVPQPAAQQTQPPYQQMYYQQYPMQQPAAPVKAPVKKKFPWFFTTLWAILFVAVGIWTYFLLMSEGYQRPQFTEDAQRFVLFTAAVALMIYTLSLKLSVKKMKVLPTVILILAVIIGFYFFSMVELTDGDWLHDTISGITESILPASGD